MDFRLTDEQQLLQRTIREFAESEIRPHVREWDEAQLITKVTGGNTSMVSLDASTLLVFTPANGRIYCRRVTLPSR